MPTASDGKCSSVPEIMDSGAVPGMGDAGLPEKAPEVFIDISQCHRLSAVTREKISGRLWKRMDLPAYLRSLSVMDSGIGTRRLLWFFESRTVSIP